MFSSVNPFRTGNRVQRDGSFGKRARRKQRKSGFEDIRGNLDTVTRHFTYDRAVKLAVSRHLIRNVLNWLESSFLPNRRC